MPQSRDQGLGDGVRRAEGVAPYDLYILGGGLMSVDRPYSVVITTCGDRELAKRLSYMLVELRLAACVQIFPVESVYVWKDSVCNDDEFVLLIKTRAELFDELVSAIRENHSYEVPEIIQIPITDGLPEYLAWISENCKE